MTHTRFPIARLLLALSLMAVGLASWAAAGVADDLAIDHERRATLRNADGAGRSPVRTLVERVIDTGTPGASAGRADDYWAGRYDSTDSRATADAGAPADLLIAANALFRRAQREAATRMPAPDRLDQALQAYAAALKNGGFDRDAAFNYEFVARLRDQVMRSKGTAPARLARSPAPRPGDGLPGGPTIHGRPGTHPPNTRGEEFEVITPMDYGDREAQPEATPGRPLPRKG